MSQTFLNHMTLLEETLIAKLIYLIMQQKINVTHADVSNFALNTIYYLATLNTEVVKVDIDKLAPVPVDLSKLSDVVKNDVFKKAVYDELVAKVDNINITKFVLKTTFDKYNLEQKRRLADVI